MFNVTAIHSYGALSSLVVSFPVTINLVLETLTDRLTALFTALLPSIALSPLTLVEARSAVSSGNWHLSDLF